jgi:hypothetical protein
MYPFQMASFEVVVRVSPEDATATHREHRAPPLWEIPPVYRTRHPFQLSIRHRPMQQIFVSNAWQLSPVAITDHEYQSRYWWATASFEAS